MAEVKLPLVGGVSKKALAIGGGSAALLITVLLLRKKKTAAAAPAAGASSGDPYPPDGTTGNPGDPNSTDPATGMTYGDEQAGSGDSGYQDTSQGYGAAGYTDPNTGQFIYGNSGTGQAAATTNAAWAQNAIAYLGTDVSVDSAALSTALGLYLAGQPLTSDQAALVDQAIAVEGYPPVSGAGGYPPGIRESGTASQGGTGGSGGGVTGSGSDTGGDTGGPAPAAGGTTAPKAAGAISNLRTTKVTKNSFTAEWNKATGATGGYRYIVDQLNGANVHEDVVHGTSVTVTNLHPGWTYNFGIQALPGGPGNNIHIPLPSK